MGLVTQPTITVAIPMHGSARWIDNIVSNVRALPPMVTEVLISDQTCIDDATDLVRELLRDDPRVTVRAEAAGLGFAEHYQQLLETAKGDLFMWMPHDDIFDPGWVPTLASALAANPQAWLAFGRIAFVRADDNAHSKNMDFPFSSRVFHPFTSTRLMVGKYLYIPFRGLFRRQNVLSAQIKMDPSSSLVSVDIEWVFSVALQAPIVYDNQALTWKRSYPESTHKTPLWKSQHRGSVQQAAIRLICKYGPGGIKGLSMIAYVNMLSIEKHLRAVFGKLPLVRKWAKSLRILARIR
jgi:GT2 family glycosyltransferase